MDINDHKPTLTVPSGNAPLNILESLDIGSMITRVTANDPDSGSEITFALNSNADGTDKFFFIDRYVFDSNFIDSRAKTMMFLFQIQRKNLFG